MTVAYIFSFSLSLSLSLSRKLLGILCKQWFNFVEVIFYVICTVWTVKEKIIKIRVETHEIKNRKSRQKSNKTKRLVFEMINEID